MKHHTIYSTGVGFLIALFGTLFMLLLLSLDLVGPASIRNDKFMVGGTILFISLYVFLLFGIYKSIRNVKKTSSILSFRSAFLEGLITSLSTAVFAVIFTILFYELIYPDYSNEMSAVVTEKLSNQGLDSVELQDKVKEQTKYYSTSIQAQFSFVGNLITGLAFTLILSLFLKSKKQKS
ncbi:MAG: DUF4199 domain-containing protein [Cytophagales bacterium]|nr:DUF4199 domain-containing protein [Cytophagales bacterium]